MDLPKRKHTPLKDYDYSLPGCYYVTIHTADPDTVLRNKKSISGMLALY